MVAEEPQPGNVRQRGGEVGGWFVFQMNAGETETQMKVCRWCVSQSEVNQKEIHAHLSNGLRWSALSLQVNAEYFIHASRDD